MRRIDEHKAQFKIFEKCFQELIERTTRRIENIKQLQKEFYGVDVCDVETPVEQHSKVFARGEDKFSDFARLIAEGMLLEFGRGGLEKQLEKVHSIQRLIRKVIGEGGER